MLFPSGYRALVLRSRLRLGALLSALHLHLHLRGAGAACTCVGQPGCWCWSNCTATLDAACGGRRPPTPGLDPAAACSSCAGGQQHALHDAGCTAAAVEAFCARRRRPVFEVLWNSPLPGCCAAHLRPAVA